MCGLAFSRNFLIAAFKASPLRFPGPEALRDAFLWEKTPKVDKSGCLSLNGLRYDVGVEYIRKNVMVRYDPFDLSQLEVWYGGEKKKLVSPVSIGEYNHNVKKAVATAWRSRGRSQLLHRR